MTQAQVTIETGKDAMEVGNGAKLVLTNIRFDSFVEQWLYVWANYPGLAVLLCLMVIDVAMGSIAATVGGKLSSNVSYKGHMKKGAILLILGSAKLMELVLPGAPLLFIGTLGFIASN